MSLKSFVGLFLGVCLGVSVAMADSAGAIQITATSASYVYNENYYSSKKSDGVHLYFVAPKSGTYQISIPFEDNVDDVKVRRYNFDYSYYFQYWYTSSVFRDTVAVSGGDTVFYQLENYYSRDTLFTFSPSYKALNLSTYKLKITSASADCYVPNAPDVVLAGKRTQIRGYGKAGYRPNGWKVSESSFGKSDSTNSLFAFYAYGDMEIELQCTSGKVYEVQNKLARYIPDNDFYEDNPKSGVRFRYTVPDTNLNVIQFKSSSVSAYFIDFGTDSLFTTPLDSSYASYNYHRSIKATPGEKHYYIVRPVYQSGYNYPFFLGALRSAIVSYDYRTGKDTIALNDSMTVSVTLPADSQMAGWHVTSGQGTFVDSNAISTVFIPKSTEVTIGYTLKKGSIYELSSDSSYFTFGENTSAGYSQYGIRTKFTAPDSGKFTLIVNSPNGFYLYLYGRDSLFKSYNTYSSMYGSRKGYTFNAEKDSTYYFLIRDNGYPRDTIIAHVDRPLKIETDTVGTGYAYVGSSSTTLDYTHVKGDTVSLSAQTPNKFLRWELVSGSCSIIDSSRANTSLVIGSDCKVRAVFGVGEVYDITSVSTRYDIFTQSYGTNGAGGVRLKFVAPGTGKYIVAITRSQNAATDVEKYSRGSFASTYLLKRQTYVRDMLIDTVTVSAGDSLFYTVSSSYTSDVQTPFWVSYSQDLTKLVLEADASMGTVTPAKGYESLYQNVAYPISARGKKFYRFDHWKTVKGKVNFGDSKASSTTASVATPSTARAIFTEGPKYTLTTVRKKFTFEDDYNNDNSSYKYVYFKWTPDDTIPALAGFDFEDSVSVQMILYGEDSTYSRSQKTINNIGRQLQFKISGRAFKPQYMALGLVPSSDSDTAKHHFAGSVRPPLVVRLRTSDRGTVYPKDSMFVYPGFDTTITATTQGGIAFSHWSVLNGEVEFDDSTSFRTTIRPISQVSTVKANYVIDENVKPDINIVNLDLNSYPGVCATLSVTDSNTNKSIIDLTNINFEIFQDDDSVATQVSSVNKIGGVSVALVVDESGSMSSNNRIEEAKASIRQFIVEMGAYDRTAIIGFSGGSNYKVRQTMTSDKELLMEAVDRLTASGGTNINTGTYYGVQQLVGETNPTAVIVFSDGDNGSESIKTGDVVDLARELNTTIHTIAIGSSYAGPLGDLANQTGGSYTMAPTAADLSDIYGEIRQAVQSRYVICYKSPDRVIDGDTHTVHISVKFQGKSATDITTWSEQFMPPVIQLTDSTKDLVGNVRHEGNGFVIAAYISSKLPITSAKVYIKKADLHNTSYTAFNMVNESDSLWVFEVADSMVVAPGLDFYIAATDSLEMIGLAPRVASASSEPYTIPVDNDPPSIEQITGRCASIVNNKGSISFSIFDEDGIYEARLYYKNSNGIVFEVSAMKQSEDQKAHWTGDIPASEFNGQDVEYYVRATDSTGLSTRWELFSNSLIDACEVDSSKVKEDHFTNVADKAEMYDDNLDGRADMVRIHFESKLTSRIYKIDSLFWNMEDTEDWREFYKDDLRISEDGMWIEASLSEAFPYGLTAAIDGPYLKFTKERNESMEKLTLKDKVGAVVVSAVKHPGETSLKNFMDGDSEVPADTLEVTMSEPVVPTKEKDGWKTLFRYSESCDDTATHAVSLRSASVIDSAKGIWKLILADHNIDVGNCLMTDTKAPYKDLAGNPMGRGGVEISGKDGIEYIRSITPNPPVAGLGKEVKWMPAGESEWRSQPDTISTIEIWSIAPYKAKITIFDGAAGVVASMNQEFGYDGEMDMPSRGSSEHRYKLGFISWNQRSRDDRKVGTGVYIWRIDFKFKDGHSEHRIVKTGIKRKKE